MNKEVLFSHKSDHWSTPKEIYDHFVVEQGYFDPCPLHSEDDNLNELFNINMFINPPYSDIKSWVKFAIKNLLNDKICGTSRKIYMLVPARTDTQWFKMLVESGYLRKVSFFTGRLKFGDSNQSAPFPSMLVYLYAIPNIFYDSYEFDSELITLEDFKNA